MKLLFVALTICIAVSVYSQSSINYSDPIPVDPDVKIGKLDNGLTYYIRYNKKPEQRAEFFLVVNAGSILENDDQNGLAHFCEHMAFNGTENFKKHQIINYLQSIGMKFGPEINAFTSHDLTNYMLQAVPVIPEANLDTALLILHDWASAVSYEGEEIDNERGVIHEEWRTRRGASFRMSIKTDKVLFEGSKYAKRDVIGDVDIIDHAPYNALRNFYKDWYRPDLEAIVVIGDFDIEKMEKKIKDLFSQIPARENEKKREFFEVPDHEDTKIAIATDPEARTTNVKVIYKHDPVKDKSTLDYLKQQTIIDLFDEMLNTRLDEITQKPDAPFSYGYAYYGGLRITKDGFVTSVYASNNKGKQSLNVVLTEHKRIKQFGFTESELKNAKKQILKYAEKSYLERNDNESSRYTWVYFSNFTSGEPIPSTEFSYEFTKKVLPEINIDDVNELANSLITENNRVIIITGPENEAVSIPDKSSIQTIIKTVDKNEVKPYSDIVLNKPLMNEDPVPGKITKETYNDELDLYEYELSNGAKVVLKKTDFKKDEIWLRAYSPGGASLYSVDDIPSIKTACDITDACGAGNYNQVEFSKFLSDKIMWYTFWISDLYEEYYGNTRPADLETFLKLIYLRFTSPNFTEEGYNVYLDKEKVFLENKKLDPASAFRDTITNVLSCYSPWRKPMDMDMVNESDLITAEKIYKERFSNPSDFTFVIIGSLDMEKTKTLVEKYIGSLPSGDVHENWKDLGINPPNKPIKKEVLKKMEVPKSTVQINYYNECPYNLKNIVLMDAIQNILDIRYTETIREEQGGTYGVSVRAYNSKVPKERYSMTIRFDCDPEKAEKLIKIAYDEINALKENGPAEKHLDYYKKNVNKEFPENIKKNSYWINYITHYYLYGINRFSETYLAAVNSLTVEDIKKAANDFINDEHHSEFILKPEK